MELLIDIMDRRHYGQLKLERFNLKQFLADVNDIPY